MNAKLVGTEREDRNSCFEAANGLLQRLHICITISRCFVENEGADGPARKKRSSLDSRAPLWTKWYTKPALEDSSITIPIPR